MSAWHTFIQTIRTAVLSRESFMVFAIASLFYLVFYGMPYDNQIIVKIPTAIVDMDQSRASHELVEKLQSAPSINAVLQTADFEQAEKAFSQSKADVIIVIAENYARDIQRGDQTVVTVFSNGALPVKGRAVSASVLTIVTEENITQAATRLIGQGLQSNSCKANGYDSRTIYFARPFLIMWPVTVTTLCPWLLSSLSAVMLFGVGIALGGWLSSPQPPQFFF